MINYNKNKITNALALIAANITILPLPFNIYAIQKRNQGPELLLGPLINLLLVNMGICFASYIFSKHLVKVGKITEGVATSLTMGLSISYLLLTVLLSIGVITARGFRNDDPGHETILDVAKDTGLAITGLWVLTPATLLVDGIVNCCIGENSKVVNPPAK